MTSILHSEKVVGFQFGHLVSSYESRSDDVRTLHMWKLKLEVPTGWILSVLFS